MIFSASSATVTRITRHALQDLLRRAQRAPGEESPGLLIGRDNGSRIDVERIARPDESPPANEVVGCCLRGHANQPPDAQQTLDRLGANGRLCILVDLDTAGCLEAIALLAPDNAAAELELREDAALSDAPARS